MNVNRFWKVPRESAKLSSMTFLCGWLAFVGAIVTIYIATGEWRVPRHISSSDMVIVDECTTCISCHDTGSTISFPSMVD